MTAVDTLAVMATVYGLITVCAPVFQTFRIHRRRSSADVSLVALWIFLGSYVVWLAYGIALGNRPLIIVETLGIATNLSTIVLAHRYRRAAIAENTPPHME